jgi:hypothetical protein
VTDSSILTDYWYPDPLPETETPAANRLDRRKVRTRAALVAAARELLASRDPAEVSIQEITDMADVAVVLTMLMTRRLPQIGTVDG